MIVRTDWHYKFEKPWVKDTEEDEYNSYSDWLRYDKLSKIQELW